MKNNSAALLLGAYVFVAGSLMGAEKPKSAGPGPRAQLSALLEQIQKSPSDNALREKAIKIARSLKPAPTTPAEALKLIGKGEYLVSQAKQPADFLAAADAFKAASNLAPWDASAYYNQGVVYEKAQKATLAIEAFNWYMKAAPGAPDTADVIKKLGGLEVAAQTQSQANDRNAILQAEYDRLKPLVEGKTFGNYMSCSNCTKSMSLGSNWYPNKSFTLTGMITLLDSDDPRLEISFAQSGTETLYNGINYIFIGRPTSGSRELTWKMKARQWGANDSNWLSAERPTWFFVSSGKLKWCGDFQGSDCEKIPLGASDPWASDPNNTFAIFDLDRR